MPLPRIMSLRLLIAGVAFLCIVLLALYMGNVPAKPQHYLTAARATELKTLADKILAEEDVGTLTVSYDKTAFRWNERLNRQPSTRFADEVVPILKRNKLHALRVDAERGSATYGQFFFRRWYEYVYVPSDKLDADAYRYRVTEHLTNGWFFGTR